MKKKLNKKSENKEVSVRETYLINRNNMIEDFESSLKEVQKDESSVGGEIAGMNFQQFSAAHVFQSIVEQEAYIDYANKYNPEYVIIEEEKKILKDMVKKAKAVFKKDYNKWLEHVKMGL